MLENRLHRAVRNDEFVLYYQPKVNLATGRTTSFEALIRWNDPELGLIAPSEFVPMLEETGMIHDVGAWVVRQAVADSRLWARDGLGSPRVAVNVSVKQLQQADFLDALGAAVGANGGANTLIDLEITESVMMIDVEDNIGRLRALREMGLDIAIDDFGTGYSSLSYLIKLPVNALKIDQSFVATMASSPESMTVVTTIISLAHALGMKVVAEGVETEEQAKILRLFKCDEFQGYLASPAMPAHEVAAYLRH
jgi:EAL domain-containing protein (putative c-di-GMP-specific phosphodiesterase class I)